MFRRTKYTVEEKYKILMEYRNRSMWIQEIHVKYRISVYAFYKWRYNYEKYGVGGLKELETYKKYSKELKEQVVQEYLSGKYSQGELVKRIVIQGY